MPWALRCLEFVPLWWRRPPHRTSGMQCSEWDAVIEAQQLVCFVWDALIQMQ